MSEPDADLVAAARRGSQRAFQQLVERHQQAVRGFLRRACADPDDADDLAQETFLAAWSSLLLYRGGASLRSWLCAIAWKKSLSLRRSRGRERRRVDSLEPNPAGELGHLLSIAGWGWHAETGLHTLRLIVSGLFDRLPTLQLIIGHMGEGLPYALARSSGILSQAAPGLRQPVASYFHTNIHLTTSGYFTVPPLRCAIDVTAIDRLLFSVDYPFSPNTRGRAFLDALTVLLSPEDIAKLTHRNAESLLGLRPVV